MRLSSLFIFPLFRGYAERLRIRISSFQKSPPTKGWIAKQDGVGGNSTNAARSHSFRLRNFHFPFSIFHFPYLVLAVALVSCAVTLPEITETQVKWASDKWPGINSDSLSDGKKQYIEKCSGCHGLKIPSQYTIEQWETIIPKMAKKAKLNSEEHNKIYKYVITLAKK